MTDCIFVALSTFAQHGTEPLDLLKESKIEFSVNPTGRRLLPEEIIRLASSATGIIAGVEPYSEEVLKNLKKLRCISRAGVGLDSVDLACAKRQGIIVRNTPEVVVRPVAELTVGMILDLLRRITVHTTYLRSGHWRKETGENLLNKTAGIIGTGRIGKKTCELLKLLGARVIANDVQPDDEWALTAGIEYVDFARLVSDSDIISIHAGGVEDSETIIGSDEIGRMKDGVIIVNTSRGNLVDEEALCVGLARKKIYGVGLDVYSAEPYHGSLTQFDNVVLTPHVATLTAQSRLEMEVEATRNLLDCLPPR